jgi:hypothetical protein
MLSARVAVSPRLVLVQTDLDAKNLEELCSRRSFASYAAWPRRDRRRSSMVLASSIPVIYQATLLPPHAFFMQVTKSHPHHDHIHSSTHRLWRSFGTCAFILVFSSCVPRVSTTTSRSSHLHILTHADLSLSCFTFFRLDHGSEPLDPSHRSLRGIAQCPLATCCLYVLP